MSVTMNDEKIVEKLESMGNCQYIISAGYIDKRYEGFAAGIGDNKRFFSAWESAQSLPKHQLRALLNVLYLKITKDEPDEVDKNYKKDNKKWRAWVNNVQRYYTYRLALEGDDYAREHPLGRLE